MDHSDHLRTETAVADEKLEIILPSEEPTEHTQDTEWCEVRLHGQRRRIRFHDYTEIFSVPGLYEQLFYEKLKCDSPRAVTVQLGEALKAAGEDPAGLRVLDVGAGNGMMGEELREQLDVDEVVGIDIIEAAAEATERDRPGVYADYIVGDLTAMAPEDRDTIGAYAFNCMACVAALGFGDIPPDAFAQAHNVVTPDGWIAFNINEHFIADGDGSGFARLISRGLQEGALEEVSRQRYQHRLAVSGEPIHYVSMVARKRGNLPYGQE